MKRLCQRLGLWDKYLDMPNGWGFLVGGVIAAVMLFAVIGGIAWKADSRNCAYASRQYKLKTHYDRLAGCYIRTPNGQSVKVEQYRAVIGR